MIEEDFTAAKLKGHNVYIKFHDGEILYLTVSDLSTDDERSEWFSDVENFINKENEYFPLADISIDRKSIKYVKMI